MNLMEVSWWKNVHGLYMPRVGNTHPLSLSMERRVPWTGGFHGFPADTPSRASVITQGALSVVANNLFGSATLIF